MRCAVMVVSAMAAGRAMTQMAQPHAALLARKAALKLLLASPPHRQVLMLYLLVLSPLVLLRNISIYCVHSA